MGEGDKERESSRAGPILEAGGRERERDREREKEMEGGREGENGTEGGDFSC